MSHIQMGILAQFALTALTIVAAMSLPVRARNAAAGLLCAGIGAIGVWIGLEALTGRGGDGLSLPSSLPFDELLLSPTPLGGFFMIVAGAVAVVASLYAIGYAHGASGSRTSWSAFALFLAAMGLVPAAADVVSFLLLWELMAVGTTVLVLCEQAARAKVRTAVLWYSVMTHLSFILILAGFAILAARSGGTGFAQISAAWSAGGIGTWSAALAAMLLLVGFATKAGIVPVHVWRARVYPEAPSHVTAVMSAAMVKMGIYGAMLVVLQLMPGGPSWWGLVLLAAGGISALYGILQASVATDVKRLLAHSTTENVGLMFLALGAGLFASTADVRGASDAAIAACLFLVASHAAFKSALFLGAGSVAKATGESDLDRMGGLGVRMPFTAAVFGIGALGAAALPVTSGFVAEWALLQALIHGASPTNKMVAVVMPLMVAVVALTAGLALLTFAKAYGIAFLARPRSLGAQLAREPGWPMRVGMGGAAVGVLGLGLLPGLMAEAAAKAGGLRTVWAIGLGGVDLSGVNALLDPVSLMVIVSVIVAVTVGVAVLYARRRPARSVDLGWGCGGVRTSPRLQYTATSYAEPLLRVFDDVVRPDQDIEITHMAESRYLVERIQYHQKVSDVFETRLYRPVFALMDRWGLAAKRLQNGSIHRYLMYSLSAFVLVLIVVAL